MSMTGNIYTLLKIYATKQNSPRIDFGEFSDYLRRCAQKRIEENSEWSAFLGLNADNLTAELNKLLEKKLVAVTTSNSGKQEIFVLAYYIDRFTAKYHEIESNPAVPFPALADLPKNTPVELITRLPAADIIYKLLTKQEVNDKILYGIIFSKEVPPVLMPSTVEMTTLVHTALEKLREMLSKEEFHDYFLKKLCISNPGKEITAKNFFNSILANPDKVIDNLKKTGETYYYWSQLCYFIKQDYDKLKDFTTEDVNILQAVSITEIATSYYKSKAQAKQKKADAFNQLDLALEKAPYFFTYEDICKFKDKQGKLLISQYDDKELKEHLSEMSQDAAPGQLPNLITFKVADKVRYFVLKQRVMPLVVRLCSDCRSTIRDNLEKIWTRSLMEFETLPEMKDQSLFERCLEKETEAAQPVLYTMLNSSFLPLINYEQTQNSEMGGKITLFREGDLIPYSEILMMSRQEILTDVKIKLPFWYTTPVISWLAALLFKKPKPKDKKKVVKTAVERIHEEEKAAQESEKQTEEAKLSRKQEFHLMAQKAEKVLVPENSTLDREIAAYNHEWNNLIGKESNDNLTEDVNSLIRDYLRKVLRTLKSSSFTLDRIKSLASSLAGTPSMQKIKNHAALEQYIVLYMVKLVKNIS